MSVVLNGNTYAVSDFVGDDGRGYAEIFTATGLQTFPESIFTDMLAELASAATVLSVSPGAAGGFLRSNGSAWVRVSDIDIQGTLTVTGNVGIGQAAGSSALEVTEASSGTNLCVFTNSHNASPFGPVIDYSAAAPNGTSNAFLTCEDNSATRFSLRSNGGLANFSANNVNLASDERLKDKHVRTASTWDAIKGLEVWEYRYKEKPDGRMLTGIMAQHTHKVAPRLFAEQGVKDGYHGINEYDLQMYGLRALQEAQHRIEALEDEVSQLKAA